jgi:hypothetical protein
MEMPPVARIVASNGLSNHRPSNGNAFVSICKDVSVLMLIDVVQFFVPLAFEACFKHSSRSNIAGNWTQDLGVVQILGRPIFQQN